MTHERTRLSYDAVAEEYAARLANELEHKPLDRALLSVLVAEAGRSSPIGDLGCGPGHVAGWLADNGAAGLGVDLSPAMVEIARARYPTAEFRQGDLVALPLSDGEVAGAAVMYSIIHLEPAELAPAFAELRRVVQPGGPVLVAFHIGNEVRESREWWGHEVELSFRFFEADEVERELEAAGLSVEARLVRQPYPEEVATIRAYVLGRRPA